MKAITLPRIWSYIKYRASLRPAPKPLVALYLSIRWRAFVSPQADILYPRRVRLGRGCRVGQCRINGFGEVALGDRVDVLDGAILDAAGGYIRIGKGSFVHSYCFLNGAGGLTVGKETGIAPHASIVAFNHGYSDVTTSIIRQPLTMRGISIGNGAWIGTNAVVLDGVTIGDGAIVAAGAVVSQSVGAFEIAAGVSAQPIVSRLTSTADRAA
jgi:acetyltransferase-like isoleucine patch superfamily enzyme